MHIPVLKKEVLEFLNIGNNENFIDCTIGEGGHAMAILEKNKPNGKVLGIDLDKRNIDKLKILENDRLILENSSYINLKEIIEKNNFYPVNGILLDLGMSSWHIDESKKGFSFLKDEPLDMRYGKEGITAEIMVNEYGSDEIENILKEYGQERYAKRIAKRIIEERKIKPIKTTLQLVEIIKKSIPSKYQKINPATRVFQALRIAVNDELNNLEKVLGLSIEVLEKKGRIAVISFHSLEDRIVKNFFKNNKSIDILTKKPITATKEEINNNPRARSAKLRLAIKI